jgi:mannose-6-phosphate isomerase-like protein (cupin superfamily)
MTEVLRLSRHQQLRVITNNPELLELESTWAPGGDRPRAHFHPAQDESFEVLEGTLTVDLDGLITELGPGERVEVPRRTVHRMWNGGTVPARAIWRVTPALGTLDMFRAIDSDPSPVALVAMLWRFRREFRLPLRTP